MKKKPSDYCTGKRYLKKDHLPDGGGRFKITDIDEVDKSIVAGEHDWRIRLTLDDRFWFEVHGPNLDSAIEILGDDFADWFGKSLGFVLDTFTGRDGEEKTYIKIVPAPEITLKLRPKSTKAKAAPASETLDPIPFN
jgi:hypothetical protein